MPIFGFTNIPGSVITQTSIAVASGGASDADAQAFITAASITDTTQISAIDQLVIDLKGYNIWTKMKAIYPIVGGSAGSHAVNLKTPGTYNLSFSTGWTHSSTGITPNGTTAYANTSLSTSIVGLNSGHLSFYSRTNNSTNSTDMGGGNPSPDSYSLLEIRSVGQGPGNTLFRYNNGASTNTIPGVADTRGFFIGTRTASNVIKLFRNSTNIISETSATSATSTRPIFISAYNNNGSALWYSNRECAFASIGDGLDDTEAANFYTAVQAYQTTLSRNV